MAKASRDKGSRRERQVVKMAQEAGFSAKRVPLSGACEGFKHDVLIALSRHCDAGFVDIPLLRAEVKGRASGGGFKTIEFWLGDADMLVIIQDRQEPLVVQRWSKWVQVARDHRLTTREMDEAS